ncbi:AAA family ATPase [Peribacillus frigoritolerans]|uniref:AAA family ATPase n=1 Tax=Peribacillus frigoritolerans TaxID=450367 RepID=UPI003B8D9CCA
MKLAYVWIGKLNDNIYVDYNLGSDYYFHFKNDTNTLHAEENHNYIKDFFQLTEPKNGVLKKETNSAPHIEINAIVGENGTGKTTILEAISEIVAKNYKNKYVLVYEREGVYTYVSREKIKINSDVLTFDVTSNGLPKAYTLYYSNVFDVGYFQYKSKKNNKFGNYTTNSLLEKADNVQGFLWKELTTQIEFVSYFKGNLFSEHFNIPKEIMLKVQHKHEFNYSVTPELKKAIENISRFEVMQKIFSSSNTNTKFKGFYFNYLKSIMYYYFYSILDLVYEVYPKESKDRFNGLFKRFKSAIDKIEEYFKQVPTGSLSDFRPILIKYLVGTNKNLKFPLPLEKTLKILQKIEKECNDLYGILTSNLIQSIYQFSATFSFKDVPLEILHIFAKWQRMNLGGLEWHTLSSGQYAMLSMFARLFDASRNMVKVPKVDLTLLLIDESELYFHPQWQKEWISVLLAGLTKLFDKHQSTIQVILTTHSPFLLSDIPSDRVLFLDKIDNQVVSRNQLDDVPLTFGANIHQLYAHSFFLKGGLMGSFAKRKINQIAERLIHSSDEEMKNNNDAIVKQIHLIGEPIIKNKLIDIYKQRMQLTVHNELAVQKEMDDLKKRISKLEEILQKRGDLE